MQEDYFYYYNERLGIMCEGKEPTQEQIKQAREEAKEIIKRFK